MDGQQDRYDDDNWLTRFTPCRRASRWSQINRIRAIELLAEGRVTPAGLTEIDAARADGRWDAAYAPASAARPCAKLQLALDASDLAAAGFATLKASERYSLLHRLANLRTANARTMRVAAVIAALEER